MYPPPMGCPHPQQYGAPGPSYAPQPYAAQPQHHAQQYTQPQPFQPHHHYYNSPLAIPAPVQRVEYQAPVFKTFQERKREREALLVGTPPPTPPQRPRAPVPPSPSHRVPSYQQPPPSPIRQPPSPHQNRSVSPAALAMLGRSGERPLPPPRAPTRTVTPMSQQSTGMQPIGQQSTGMPPIQKQPAGMVYAPQIQQQPTGIPQQLQQQPRGMGYAPMQNHPSGNAPAMPRAPPSSSPLSHTVSPAQISRNVSPAPQIELSSRSVSPAPPPPEITLARSASPAHQVPTIVVPASPSPAMPQIVTPNASSPPISHINPRGTPPVTSPPMNPRALPHPKAPVERSDTIASVKSLDRAVGMKRTLPQLPVGVSPSRSLDRGPTQETPAQLAHRMAGVSIGGIVPSRVPRRGFRASNVVAPTALSISVASPPSKPINLGDIIPAINVASPRTSTIATIVMPAISVGSTPTPTVSTISVGSPPTPTVPAINVPTISVGSPPTPSVPAISVGSPPTPTLPSIPVGAPAPSIKAPEAAPRPPPSPPGVAFTPLPTIEVESGDTRYSSIGHRIQPSAAILCAGCSNPIIGRIVRAMGQRWHPACFKCGVCAGPLEHVSAYEHAGKPYCHLDYHDRFAHRCHHCRTPIVDARFITLDTLDNNVRHYHELHFFCSECGDPFLDPSKSSAAGTELNQHEEIETSDFVVHKGHPYCERCHLRLHKPRCKACRLPIPDVAVSAMGGKWHQDCFVCVECKRGFANNLFFPREGKAYCTECFEGMN